MKRTITITYEWRKAASANEQARGKLFARGSATRIRPEHIEFLEESAEDIIFARLSGGYREGTLCDHIRMDESDGDEGVEYTGWFTIQKTQCHSSP
jgi:hypothetical protein